MRTGTPFVAVLVVLALAGCTPSGVHVPASPSASATPVFASDADALKAAEAAYAAYLKVSDEIANDGGANPERIQGLVTGQLASEDLKSFRAFLAKGWRSVGASKISSFTLESANTTTSTSTQDAVVAYVCDDVSGVDVVDAGGTSVVATTRPDVQSFEVAFDLLGSHLVPSSREPWSGSAICG